MDNPLMFPTAHNVVGNAVIDGGITLRDHFAGLAMQGILTSMSELRNNGFGYSAEELASECYTVADGMLKARKEVKP